MITTGQILNNTYKIIEQIGSGGGGIVYKAYHLRLEKYVAVKLIKDEVKDAVDRRAEADILKRLKHEGLPQVYDFVADGGEIYTVMEFIEGGTLYDDIAEHGVLSYGRALRLAKELCSAAAYLHSRKPPIIHSDIKPQNIMLTNEDKLCLIDFNISSVFGGGIYTVGSSDGYSPPELYTAKEAVRASALAADNSETVIIGADDDAEAATEPEKHSISSDVIDSRSDVYSIGAVMYSMVTGMKPRNSLKGAVPLKKINENVPDSYAMIVEKAMKPDKKDRFASAAEMLNALEKLERFDRRYKKMTRRHIVAYVFCLLLLAASAVSAVVGYDMMNTEKDDRFSGYVSQLEDMVQSGEYDDFDSVYEAAAAEEPDSPVPDYYSFVRAYDEGDMENAVRISHEKLEKRVSELSVEMQSNYYFILADISFESDDYEAAVGYYALAAKENPENPDIYRDYAIALARSGDTASAEKILEKAIALGLEKDGIYMADGEIAFMNGDMESAVSELKNGIELTHNDILKRNAYLLCSRAYQQDKNEESISEDISLLEKALLDLPAEMTMQVREYLAQAYIDLGETSGKTEYYANAVSVLDDMKGFGRSDYRTEMNIAVLLDRLGDTKRCKNVLKEMAENPDYEPYYFTIWLRLAYCEADIQSELDASERDYSEFEKYYLAAEAAYSDYTSDGNSDPEMERLRETREEMKKMGWIK